MKMFAMTTLYWYKNLQDTVNVTLCVGYPILLKQSVNEWRGIPGKEVKYENGRIISYAKMNSYGFRDKERNYEKGKDVFRIIVLGDSFTEGLQVPLEKTFPYILEETLNSIGIKNFEVINLGISGFSTAQEYLALKYYGLKYQPDFVILEFTLGNDVVDNSKTFFAL